MTGLVEGVLKHDGGPMPESLRGVRVEAWLGTTLAPDYIGPAEGIRWKRQGKPRHVIAYRPVQSDASAEHAGVRVSDEAIVYAMLAMSERAAEKEEPGFWQDRARAHIAKMKALPVTAEPVQAAIHEARLFLAALQAAPVAEPKRPKFLAAEDGEFNDNNETAPADPVAGVGEPSFAMVWLNRGPYPAALIDDLNGYITGGSTRCLDALVAHGVDVMRRNPEEALAPSPSVEKLVGALEPFARLEIPAKSVANAGAYSILHSDIRRAAEAVAQAKGIVS